MSRIAELREQGETCSEIARRLNAEGFKPARRHKEGFNNSTVESLIERRGLIGRERSHDELLGKDEWWLTGLARKLRMDHNKLRSWAVRGWIHGRQTPIQACWILWRCRSGKTAG